MKAIVAVDKNWGIGYKNELLFHIPDDLKRFRTLTLGATVIMGRKTLESLPGARPLPKRRNIVLSRQNLKRDDIIVAHNIDELLSMTEKDESSFVIGGGEIYKQLLPQCNTIYVTKIFAETNADTFYPNLDNNSDYKITSQSDIFSFEDLSYQYITYERKI